MNIEIELGQSKSFIPIQNYTASKNTNLIGSVLNKYDSQNYILLNSRPANNLFTVKIFDNNTNKISTDNFEYILQLYFKKKI